MREMNKIADLIGGHIALIHFSRINNLNLRIKWLSHKTITESVL